MGFCQMVGLHYCTFPAANFVSCVHWVTILGLPLNPSLPRKIFLKQARPDHVLHAIMFCCLLYIRKLHPSLSHLASPSSPSCCFHYSPFSAPPPSLARLPSGMRPPTTTTSSRRPSRSQSNVARSARPFSISYTQFNLPSFPSFLPLPVRARARALS